MPYFYDEGGNKIEKDAVTQNIAYTADGFLLPCCWCDAPSARKDMEDLGMYSSNLKVTENDTLTDILYSNQWKNFVDTIMHRPNEAPTCCHRKCGVFDE